MTNQICGNQPISKSEKLSLVLFERNNLGDTDPRITSLGGCQIRYSKLARFRFRFQVVAKLIVIFVLYFSSLGYAQDSDVSFKSDLQQEQVKQQNKSDAESDEPKIPPALQSYMGRRIARTMHYNGAEWLIRDEREREERCSLMLANLGVKPGMSICDMGCGNGYHTLQLAKMTGEKGLVVGVDVQPEMLSFLRERMEDQGIENVIPILGSFHNPHLPPESIDMILLVDVYHEFSHPVQMLASMRASLKPGGVIVMVEYREEDPKVPIKPLHKMSKAQVDKELTANGFKLVSEFDKLPWQHMMFYGKDESWNPENQPRN